MKHHEEYKVGTNDEHKLTAENHVFPWCFAIHIWEIGNTPDLDVLSYTIL